jgi:hypothetical protein
MIQFWFSALKKYFKVNQVAASSLDDTRRAGDLNRMRWWVEKRFWKRYGDSDIPAVWRRKP